MKADWLKMHYQLKKCWHYPTHQGTVEIYSSISCRLNYCCSVPTEEFRFVRSCEMCNLSLITINSHFCNHFSDVVWQELLLGLILTTLSGPVPIAGRVQGMEQELIFWTSADNLAWGLPHCMHGLMAVEKFVHVIVNTFCLSCECLCMGKPSCWHELT